MAMMERMRLGIEDLGSYKNLRDTKSDNFYLDQNKNVVENCQEQLSSIISIWRSLIKEGHLPFERSENDEHIKGKGCEARFGLLSKNYHDLELQLEHIESQMKFLHGTADNLSKTKLTFVQILESRKATSQADSVSRLTNLAFIFVPLIYVATIFGANIKGIDDHLCQSSG